MVFKQVILLGSALGFLIAGCGEKKAETGSADALASAEGLPKATIMVVPVDADGNERTDLAQMRTVDTSVEGMTNQELVSEFENGKAVTPKLDEEGNSLSDSLDADAESTESWFGWRERRIARKRAKWCGGSYCDYLPRCRYQGRTWTYRPVQTQCVTTCTTCTTTVNSCGYRYEEPIPSFYNGSSYQVGYQDGYSQYNYPQTAPQQQYQNYNVYGWQIQ